jgi:hypothetical protein
MPFVTHCSDVEFSFCAERGDHRSDVDGATVGPAKASRFPAEVDLLGLDYLGRPPRRCLIGPIQIRVRDDLVRRRRSPCRAVLRRVGVTDKGYVVPPDERAVDRRADASIGLCANDDELPDTEAQQHGLKGSVLEGVTVVLFEKRFGVARYQLRDDPPVVTALCELLAEVLDPDDGDPFPPRFLDKTADVGDDRVAFVSPLDDAVLHIHDEERCVWPFLKSAHSLTLLTLNSSAHPSKTNRAKNPVYRPAGTLYFRLPFFFEAGLPQEVVFPFPCATANKEFGTDDSATNVEHKGRGFGPRLVALCAFLPFAKSAKDRAPRSLRKVQGGATRRANEFGNIMAGSRGEENHSMRKLEISICLAAVSVASISASGQVSLNIVTDKAEQPVAGLPFMADESVVAAQQLDNGVTIRHEMKGRVYRSSQGCERIESTPVVAEPGQPEPATVVWVIDPVKHTALNWNTHLKTAALTHLPAGGGASVVLLAKPRVPGGELKLPPEDTTTTDLGAPELG